MKLDQKLLIALSVAVAVWRLALLNVPTGPDVNAWTLMADGIIHGQRLYTDLFDHKPPGIHLAFIPFVAIFGPGKWAVVVLWLVATWSSMGGLYRLARLVTPGTALWSAIFFAATCCSLPLWSQAPNAEVLINATLPWAAYFCLTRSPWTCGLLLFVACSLKPQCAIFFIPALFMFRRLNVLRLVAPAIVGAALICAWFGLSGRWVDFWDANVVYNRWYAGSVARNLMANAHWLFIWPAFMSDLAWTLPLACTGMVLGKRPIPAIYAACALVSVLMMKGHNCYYYQILVPPACLAAAAGLGMLGRPGLVGTIAVSLVVACQIPNILLPPAAWCDRQFGPMYNTGARAADQIDRALPAERTFYQWGGLVNMWYESKRPPPVGIYSSVFLTEGNPIQDKLRSRLLSQLDSSRPALIIVWKMFPPPPAPFLDWLGAHYSRVQTDAILDVWRLSSGPASRGVPALPTQP